MAVVMGVLVASRMAGAGCAHPHAINGHVAGESAPTILAHVRIPPSWSNAIHGRGGCPCWVGRSAYTHRRNPPARIPRRTSGKSTGWEPARSRAWPPRPSFPWPRSQRRTPASRGRRPESAPTCIMTRWIRCAPASRACLVAMMTVSCIELTSCTSDSSGGRCPQTHCATSSRTGQGQRGRLCGRGVRPRQTTLPGR